MKIHCDVCNKEEASVFCCADEAALCSRCDPRIHGANKLSKRHRRFSLLKPTSSSSSHDPIPPLCDVCQERRGFFFCQEDRATLCMDCDASIHKANRHAMKHNRFLLTGLRVSSDPIASDVFVPATLTNGDVSSTGTNVDPATRTMISNNSSSISEYLTKLLPGWHVEDFLSNDAATISKNNETHEMFGSPIWNPSTNIEYLDQGNFGFHENANKRQKRRCHVCAAPALQCRAE